MRLVLERAKRLQLALLAEQLLDGPWIEGADEFVFEIPETHKEAERLHVRKGQLGP